MPSAEKAKARPAKRHFVRTNLLWKMPRWNQLNFWNFLFFNFLHLSISLFLWQFLCFQQRYLFQRWTVNFLALFLKNIILARFASQIYNTSIWPALHVYTRRLLGSNQAPRKRILTLNSPVHRLTASLVVLVSTHEQRFLAIIDAQITSQCRR